MNDKPHWVETWILNMGRRFCIFVGATAVVAMALGAVALLAAGGYWAFGKPSKPKLLPEVQAPPPMSLDDARKNMKPDFQFKDGPGDVGPVEDATVAKAAALKDLFPESQYHWDAVIQDYCRIPSSYGCIERGQRVSNYGVNKFAAAFLDAIPVEEQDEAITNLQRLLKDAKVEERGNLVAPIIATFHWQAQTQKKAKDDRDAENVRREATWYGEVEAYHGRALFMFLGGAYGIACGLAAALGICTIVALLAIERHLSGRQSPASPQS